MAAIAETAVSLRLFGDDLDPERITIRLGGAPTKSWKKGDLFGANRRLARKSGAWILRAEKRGPGDLDAQIDEIFSKLTSDLSVWKDLTAKYRSDLFVGFFLEESNEGIDLTSRSVSLLSERNVPLSLDVYGARPALETTQVADERIG